MIGTITNANIHIVEMPLKRPFTTHLQTLTNRKALILELITEDGLIGLGEGVAFSSPWYTEETVETEREMLTQWLLPLILHKSLPTPSEAYALLGVVRKNNMAKAAIDMALWDLYAQRKQQNLSACIGGIKESISVGAVLATSSNLEMEERAAALYRQGYKRFKVKVDSAESFQQIRSLQLVYPSVSFMVDANGAFTWDDLALLKEMDKAGFLLIEQPFAVDDLVEHAKLQKVLATPICLDESITSLDDLKTAHALGSLTALNVKIGRVGGITPALQMIDYCKENGIHVWCGGMVEFGVSRAVNVALASRKEFIIPGDIVSASVYWERDLVTPAVEVGDGTVQVFTKPGIGVRLDRDFLPSITLETIRL